MITVNIIFAKHLHKKVFGLIGKKEIKPLLIKTRWGIHTFGVRFPIDIVVLDQNNLVVKLKKSLLPNRIFLWNPSHFHVLELPEGTIKNKGFEVGKKIKLEFN